MNLIDIEGKYKINESFTITLGFNRDTVRVPVDIRSRQSKNFHDTVVFEKDNILSVSVFDDKGNDYSTITFTSENDGIKHEARFTIEKGDDKSLVFNYISDYLEKF